jgi:Tol biopolymer transport system component
MKNHKLFSLVSAIILITLACALPQTGSTPTNLPTNLPTDITEPTLPPEPVLVVPAVNGEIAYSSDREGKWGVWVMNADGSNEINLTSAFGEYNYPAWSPDGQRLAMRIDFGTGSGIAIMNLQESAGKLNGTQPIAITSTFSDAPSWAPDGNQLVYKSSGDYGWQVYRYTVSSGATVPINDTSPWIQYPKWSPDGSKLLFGADTNNDGNSDIFIANPDGSGLIQLTNHPYYEGTPNWSPDGQRIVFSSNGNGNQDLYIMNMDGSGLIQLTNDPNNETDASWSPDGTRIAFVSDRNANNDGNSEIYVINTDGSAEMRLTNNHSSDIFPTWRPISSANGQQACQSQTTFLTDITIPAGTRFTQQSTFTKVWRLQNTGQCTWTPNSFRLRFVGGDLMGAPAAIPMPGAILPGASVDIPAQFTSPSTAGNYSNTWQLLDASGNPVSDASNNPLTLRLDIEVMVAGSNILPAPLYFLTGEKSTQQIWRMEKDGLTRTQLTNEQTGVERFELNPKDNQLVYISNYQLILFDPGSSLRTVLVSGDENHAPRNPVFSPDGAILAYGLGGIHLYNLSNGQDQIILADNDTMSASERRIYSPHLWSPDGSKLSVSIGYWEWGGSGIVSIADGSLLSEFEYGDSEAWSNDSQTYYSARATGPGMMMDSTPGLYSITATPKASLQTVIPDVFCWWPYQSSDGRLVSFQGTPDPTDPSQYNISLMGVTSEAGNNWQVLRENILHLPEGGFPEAVWAQDGYFLAARLFHLPSKTTEVVLIGFGDTPMVYLMPTATNLRFGK